MKNSSTKTSKMKLTQYMGFTADWKQLKRISGLITYRRKYASGEMPKKMESAEKM